VPIVPILMGCEVDVLQPGTPIIEAGFGDSDDNGNGFGRKRWVATSFNRTSNGAANVGGNGKGYCYGDSGGPAFVKLAGGSWRAFGIVSEGTGPSCADGDLIAYIHKAVPWIEQMSGIDITPCTNADGTWNPSAACTGFSLAPDGAGRTWSNGCAEPVMSGREATCGPPFGGDAGPPVDAPPPDSAGPRDAAVEGVGGRGGTGGQGGGGSGGQAGGGGAGKAGNAGQAGAGGTGMGGSAGAGGTVAAGTGGRAGTAGASGGSGASGTAGRGGAGGQAGTKRTGGGSAEEPGGCSCRIAQAHGDRARIALAVFALLALAGRRIARDRRPRSGFRSD
jgi:hypothetical protein